MTLPAMQALDGPNGIVALNSETIVALTPGDQEKGNATSIVYLLGGHSFTVFGSVADIHGRLKAAPALR